MGKKKSIKQKEELNWITIIYMALIVALFLLVAMILPSIINNYFFP